MAKVVDGAVWVDSEFSVPDLEVAVDVLSNAVGMVVAVILHVTAWLNSRPAVQHKLCFLLVKVNSHNVLQHVIP